MAHFSFWQLGLHFVTAMLISLPYNSIKFYCANTKLDLILIYQHAHCIETFFTKCSHSQYAIKQSTIMIILLYTVLNFKYIILQLYLVQCKDTY